MELVKKEVYITGADEEPAVSEFVDEINVLKDKHQLKLDKQKTAFLIMDMQNFFFDRNSHAFVPSAPNIIKRIMSIRKRVRGKRD